LTERERIVFLLNQAADRYGVDRRYIHSIAHIESRHRHFVSGNVIQSRVGALGVMQLMPATAAGLGVNPINLEDNIEGGVRYFRQRLDLAGGDVPTAIAMYYAGIGNVRQRGALQWPGVQTYIRNFQGLVNSPSILAMARDGEQARPELPTVTPIVPTVTPTGQGVNFLFIVLVVIVLIGLLYL
jgi:hypothetical protein